MKHCLQVDDFYQLWIAWNQSFVIIRGYWRSGKGSLLCYLKIKGEREDGDARL